MEARWLQLGGDPTWTAWCIVLLYAACAWLVVRVLEGARPALTARERWFWRGLLLAIVVLGLNKQLDLQTVLTSLGRRMTVDNGLHAHRGLLKRAFLVGVAFLGLLAVALPSWLIRRSPAATWLAWSGALVLAAFVVLRAATFQRVAGGALDASPVWMLEVFGTSLVGSAAWLRARSGPQRGPKPSRT